ncbi:MAG: ABC transporter permease [Candidatus Omnitrophota bacterium]|jgi:ribose/xylose/arabinose/galactoside ABC-type transport system permease subunit|nr:MAG: ABC transporter permease [Candidatus Omnitrophota bacterium]
MIRDATMKTLYRLIDTFGIGVIFGLLCLFFAVQSDIFFTKDNFSNILIQSSVNIIIATGMTFVICAAEIDLSVGSLLALCGMITAFTLQIDPEAGLNMLTHAAGFLLTPFPDLFPGQIAWWLVCGGLFVLIVILSGAIAGSVAGFIVVRFGIPSFIVTLGFMMIYRGLARYITNAAPVIGLPPQFMMIGSGVWFEFLGFRVSYSLAIALFVVVMGAVMLSTTRFGRHVLAVGGNAQAAYLSGVPVVMTRFKVFVLAGICVSIASVVQTSRLFIGDPNAGEGYELNAIAAVIIGGTSLFGGKGSVIGTCFGALIIGVLRNGLDLMNVTDHIKQIVIGSMIIFAVLLDYYRRTLYRFS